MGEGVRKTAYLSLFTVVSLIFSYIETLLPFNIGIPGIKLGLANIISVVLIYLFGFKESLIVLICRIVLSGFLFGSMYGILYSFFGGIISLVFMYIVKKTRLFNLLSVSVTGGVMHNIGQLIAAVIVVKQIKIAMYGPVLIISGLITGLIIGIISRSIIEIARKYLKSDIFCG